MVRPHKSHKVGYGRQAQRSGRRLKAASLSEGTPLNIFGRIVDFATTPGKMKTVLLACLLLCLASGVVAVAQSPPYRAIPQHQAADSRVSTIMGTVRATGQTLTFVTDQRAWHVDNPAILEGHEGHYLRLYGRVYPEKNSIHITEVKPPTANESRRNDAR